MRPVAIALRSSAVVLAAALLAPSAFAETAVIVSGRDNTLYQATVAPFLSNGAGPTFFAGRTAQPSNSIRRGLLWFDVAGSIPAAAQITSAVLLLNLSATPPGTFNVTLHRVNASWGEGTSNAGESGGAGAPATTGDATWVHRFFPATNWATLGGEFTPVASATTSVGGLGNYTWGSTAAMVADVQAWLNLPANNHGWLVRGSEGTIATAKRFESRESVNEGLRPTLTVEYTLPVPAESATWGRIKAGYRD